MSIRNGAFTFNANIALGKGFRNPWKKVSSFLTKVADVESPTRLAIVLYEGEEVPQHFVDARKEEFDRIGAFYGWSSIGAYTQHQWVVPNDTLDEYVSMLEDLRPFPKAEFGPLALNVRVDFKLIGPDGVVLPFQSPGDYGCFVSRDRKAEELGNSRLDLELSENSRAHLFICVPLEEEGSDLQRHVEFLNVSSPFNLNPRMWKQWSKSKSSNSYKKRRVALESRST
jgi:hypothetical protein